METEVNTANMVRAKDRSLGGQESYEMEEETDPKLLDGMDLDKTNKLEQSQIRVEEALSDIEKIKQTFNGE